MRMIKIGLLGVFFSMLGCDRNNSDIQTYVMTLKDRVPQEMERPQEIVHRQQLIVGLQKSLRQQKKERQSPFVKVGPKEEQQQNIPSLSSQHKPLVQPLDTLKLVGTLKQGHKVWALIQTTQGLVEHAVLGDSIGPNFGVITDIKSDRLLIMEKIKADGQWVSQKKVLMLH